MKPKALDLFCKAGGTSTGLYRAGFDMTGVDIEPQKRYPFKFIQADALEFCAEHGHLFDLIVAGPPCQAYSRLKGLTAKEYPKLIEATRQVMQATGKPYIIENVSDAWREMVNPLMLCGTMFPELRVRRHRLFECSPVIWFPPGSCYHWGRCGNHQLKNSLGKRVAQSFENCDFLSVSGKGYIVADGRKAMGINWMTGAELTQAIPPAYTEWLGKEMLKLIGEMI